MSLLDRLKQLFADAKQVKETAPAAPPASMVELPDGQTSIPERRGRERVNAVAGTKVLVIDDSATIVALMSRMLKQNEYEVLEAEDAEKGLEIAYRDNPAIIFLDIVLPGMSGFTALRHLRQDPRTKNIPIIMISGNEQATEQFYVQRIGADDFMKKPFSRAELFTRIQKLLDKNLVPVRFNEYVHATETAVEEDNAEQIAENENEAEKSN
jgi:twitching motility two-component system response regulator PilH